MNSLPRFRQPEIMDEPGLDEDRHRLALDALGRINRLSFSVRQLWEDIRPVAASIGGPLRVLDVACGGGDVALGLQKLAAGHGIEIELCGCDHNELAVRRARELAVRQGSNARFLRVDVLRDALPEGFHVIYSTLFLHHLNRRDAVSLLRSMASAALRQVVVQDLERSRIGIAIAHLGVRLLTRSDVARFDGPVSVRAAFTPSEALELAHQAGLEARIRRCWPWRFSLVCEKP